MHCLLSDLGGAVPPVHLPCSVRPQGQSIRRKDTSDTHTQVASSCGLGFLLTWRPDPKGKRESQTGDVEAAHHHRSHVLMFNADRKALPRPRRGTQTPSRLPRDEGPSDSVRSMCRMKCVSDVDGFGHSNLPQTSSPRTITVNPSHAACLSL